MKKKFLLRFRGNTFFSNTSWMMGERIFQMVISLLVGMLTARYLGPTNYGVISYVAALVAFATPICGLGLEGVLIKKFVERPGEEGKLIGTAIVMELCSAVVCSFVIVGFVAVTNVGDQVKVSVAMLESIYLLFKSADVIEYWYQSKLKSKYTSTIKMIGYTCMSIYRVVLLILGKSVEWFALATSLDMVVIAVLYYGIYRKHNKAPMRFNAEVGSKLLKESYHFIISGLMVVIYAQMDKVMIQVMLGDQQVGLYSAAYTICNLWFFVPTALIASARPLIMQAKDANEQLYLRRIQQLYSVIFWLGVIVSVSVTLFSRTIMSILYGQAYMDACGALVISIWYGIFAQLGSARSIWILCENKNKYVKFYVGIGVVVNLVLNTIMIPVWGINGAAFATLITQITVCIFAPLLYRETRTHTILVFQAIVLKWKCR